jgi:hypothetical protein
MVSNANITLVSFAMIVPTSHSIGPNHQNPLKINKNAQHAVAAKVGQPSHGTQISSNARQHVEASSLQGERRAHHPNYYS